MKRDLQSLADETFDVLIIGGGIYGACAAWDSALRGLKVALVEKGDFGHATSANSMKVIHGGLRYLQDGNLRMVRALNREREIFMHIAPHLVHPLSFIMPTHGRGLRSKGAFGLAMAMNNYLGAAERNNVDPAKKLPRARTVGTAELEKLAPGMHTDGVTGGAVWYDAQVYNTERLTLAFVMSASNRGAAIANYIEATEIRRSGNRVLGARLFDRLEDKELEVSARVVLIAAGASLTGPLSKIGVNPVLGSDHLALAVNLVTRQILPEHGIGLRVGYSPSNGASPSRRAHTAFIVPWRDQSLVGTFLLPRPDPMSENGSLQGDVDQILLDINRAYPPAQLTKTDVRHVHKGLVPVVGDERTGLELMRRSRVVDHQRADGIDGLISVVGVKYTTARMIAKELVDLIFVKLGKLPPECRTYEEPLLGGGIDAMHQFLREASESRPAHLPEASVENIARSYGSEYPRLYETIRADPAAASLVDGQKRVVRAQVLQALRHEMAMKLSDVVMRRTDLGAAGVPGAKVLRDCADLVAAEVGWSKDRVEQELREVQELFHVDRDPRVPQH